MNIGKKLVSSLLALCVTLPAILPAALAEPSSYAQQLEIGRAHV